MRWDIGHLNDVRVYLIGAIWPRGFCESVSAESFIPAEKYEQDDEQWSNTLSKPKKSRIMCSEEKRVEISSCADNLIQWAKTWFNYDSNENDEIHRWNWSENRKNQTFWQNAMNSRSWEPVMENDARNTFRSSQKVTASVFEGSMTRKRCFHFASDLPLLWFVCSKWRPLGFSWNSFQSEKEF